MSYRILPAKAFAKDFRKLDGSIRKAIKEKFKEVAKDPTRYKKLHYSLKGSCCIWVGKLRVIFSYDESKKEIYLEKIVFGHGYPRK